MLGRIEALNIKTFVVVSVVVQPDHAACRLFSACTGSEEAKGILYPARHTRGGGKAGDRATAGRKTCPAPSRCNEKTCSHPSPAAADDAYTAQAAASPDKPTVPGMGKEEGKPLPEGLTPRRERAAVAKGRPESSPTSRGLKKAVRPPACPAPPGKSCSTERS